MDKHIRTLYEYFNLYCYVVLPLFVITIYSLLSSTFSIAITNEYNVEVAIGLISILLTMFTLYVMLPNNKYRTMMKEYGHDKIIINSLFYGFVVSLVLLLFSLMKEFYTVQPYLFLVATTEMFLSVYWLKISFQNIRSFENS